jgi:hypothetical protein
MPGLPEVHERSRRLFEELLRQSGRDPAADGRPGSGGGG